MDLLDLYCRISIDTSEFDNGINNASKTFEDFSKRSKITQTQISIFKELGVLKDLPEKEREQMSLFDFF